MFRKFPSGNAAADIPVRSRRISAQVLLFLLLVASVALLINAMGFRQRLDEVRSSSSDNIGWVVAQLEVDHQSLMIELRNANLASGRDLPASISPDRFLQIKREFDIFYSRIDIFAATIRRLPIAASMEGDLIELDRVRKRLAKRLDALGARDAEKLDAFAKEVISAYPIVRDVTVRALQEITAQAARDRRAEEALFTRFFIQSIFLFVLMGVGTFLVVRLWRELEARAIATNRIAAMLSTAFDSTLNGVIVADSNLKIKYCNDVLRKLLGYGAATDVEGLPLWDVLVLEGALAREIGGLVRDGSGSPSRDRGPKQGVCRRRDGSVFPIEVTLAQDEGFTGETLNIGFIRDISHRVEAEKKQHKALLQAEQAAQAKSRFLATMSHEMRTPLHGLMASLDLLQQDQLNAEQQTLLKTARDCSTRALMQIDDVLELTRLGESREKEAAFHPEDIASDIVEELRPLAGQRDNSIDLVLNGPFERYRFTGLPVAFSRALYNLAGNAVKFTSNGEISVRLTLGSPEKDRAFLLVEVQDTGPGIAPEDQKRIFDSFETAARSEVSAQTGTGLGLSIARLAIEQQGGRLSLESDIGTGSRFFFSVPLRVEHVMRSFGRGAVHGSDPVVGGDDTVEAVVSTKRILVVDDNEVNLTLMAEMVRRMGHSPSVAQNGAEALELARNEFYDVILMDFSMPVMDGPTSARLIRESDGPSAQSVIIGVTALVEAYMDKEQAAPMAEILVKPINPQQLSAAILHTVFNPNQDGATEVVADPDEQPRSVAEIVDDLCEKVGRETALRLIRATLDDARSAIDALHSDSIELEEKVKIVHKAVGSTGLMGFSELSQAFSEAESCALRGCDPTVTDIPGTAEDRFEDLLREIARLLG